MFKSYLKHLKHFSSLEKRNLNFKRCVFEGTLYVSNLKELAIYRNDIIETFGNMIRKKQLNKIEEHPAPIIGVHIRRGDFNTIGKATEN